MLPLLTAAPAHVHSLRTHIPAQPLRGGDPHTSHLWGSPPHAPSIPGAGSVPRRTSLLTPKAQAEPVPSRTSFQSPGLSLRGEKKQKCLLTYLCTDFHPTPQHSPLHGAGWGQGVERPSSTHAPLQRSSGPAQVMGAQLRVPGKQVGTARHRMCPPSWGGEAAPAIAHCRLPPPSSPLPPLAAPHADSSSSLA